MSDPDITVTVTADPDTNALLLDGQRTDHTITIEQGQSAQTIEWALQLDEGQTGSFNPVDGSDTSGFAWTCSPQPSANIFDNASEPQSLQVEIQDTDTSASDEGEWTYKLRATVDGVLCQTNPTSPIGGQGDPIIHNQ